MYKLEFDMLFLLLLHITMLKKLLFFLIPCITSLWHGEAGFMTYTY